MVIAFFDCPNVVVMIFSDPPLHFVPTKMTMELPLDRNSIRFS